MTATSEHAAHQTPPPGYAEAKPLRLRPGEFGGVTFYHLTATPLEHALPKLLEKVIAGGHRALVVAGSDEDMERLNQTLWTYDPGSFLPHGSMRDGQPEKQPILLSTNINPCNGANMLVITNGQTVETPETFERILDLFDGKDAQAVEKARTRWTHYKGAGYDIAYQKQTDAGGWERKEQ